MNIKKLSNYDIVNFKSKPASYFTSKRWVYSGIRENCNPGQTSCCKTVGKSGEQRRGTLFLRRKGVSCEGFYELKVD